MSENKSAPTAPRTDDLEIPLSQRKTVKTLLPGDCRWPFGDPLEREFHFCGKQKADGNPYCEFHMRRAFQAARPRAVSYKLISA
jgi:GcrA cell cycle regulator